MSRIIPEEDMTNVFAISTKIYAKNNSKKSDYVFEMIIDFLAGFKANHLTSERKQTLRKKSNFCKSGRIISRIMFETKSKYTANSCQFSRMNHALFDGCQGWKKVESKEADYRFYSNNGPII